MFNWKLPTAQMQGTFKSWSNEHVQSFQRLLTEIGQVCILIETTPDEKNPYSYEKVCAKIVSDLGKLNFDSLKILELIALKETKFKKLKVNPEEFQNCNKISDIIKLFKVK